MDTIGLDLHKRESQLCMLTEAGEIVERRIVTSRERFTAVLGDRTPARILVEASTESEWVARHLESLGHEVVVADPNFAPMYATRRRGVKTDRRDARTLAVAAGDPVVARLRTVPGIGPVTAVAFVATLDVVTRFASAHHVAAYLGLTPREYSSGEQQHRGRISKTGSPRMRALLVEAAWRVLRSQDPAAAPLRVWAERIAQRRGNSVAAVALARRLAGILYALWRDDAAYRAPAPRRGAVTDA